MNEIWILEILRTTSMLKLNALQKATKRSCDYKYYDTSYLMPNFNTVPCISTLQIGSQHGIF